MSDERIDLLLLVMDHPEIIDKVIEMAKEIIDKRESNEKPQ